MKLNSFLFSDSMVFKEGTPCTISKYQELVRIILLIPILVNLGNLVFNIFFETIVFCGFDFCSSLYTLDLGVSTLPWR